MSVLYTSETIVANYSYVLTYTCLIENVAAMHVPSSNCRDLSAERWHCVLSANAIELMFFLER